MTTQDTWAVNRNAATYSPEGMYLSGILIESQDGRTKIAYLVEWQTQQDVETRAALIAQAPDLLRIARAYRNLLKVAARTDGDIATFHHIEAVIAKAEGGQP